MAKTKLRVFSKFDALGSKEVQDGDDDDDDV